MRRRHRDGTPCQPTVSVSASSARAEANANSRTGSMSSRRIETTKVFERTQVRGVSSANRARVRQHTPFAQCMPYLIHHYRLPLAVLSRTPGPPSTDLCSCRLQVEARRPDLCGEAIGPSGIATRGRLGFSLAGRLGGTMDEQAAPHWETLPQPLKVTDLAILRAPRLHAKRKACSA